MSLLPGNKAPSFGGISYGLFDCLLSIAMGIQWAILSMLMLMIFVRSVYTPDEIWLLFSIISICVGIVLIYFWPRVCLCDESQAETDVVKDESEVTKAGTEVTKDEAETKAPTEKEKPIKPRKKSRGRSRSKKRKSKKVKEEPEIDSKSTFDYEFKQPAKKQERSKTPKRERSKTPKKSSSRTPKRRRTRSRSKTTKSDDKQKQKKDNTQLDRDVSEETCKLSTEPTVIVIKVEPPECNKDATVEIQTNVDKEDLQSEVTKAGTEVTKDEAKTKAPTEKKKRKRIKKSCDRFMRSWDCSYYYHGLSTEPTVIVGPPECNKDATVEIQTNKQTKTEDQDD